MNLTQIVKTIIIAIYTTFNTKFTSFVVVNNVIYVLCR